MVGFERQKMREQYLERLLGRYGTLTLPIDAGRVALPLQTIFQPMVLRRDPLAPQERREEDIVKARDSGEALTKSEHGRMVVLGGPGMGKTTALKALLSTAITTAQGDPSAALPLFISLPDLMRIGLAFEEYIRQVVAELEMDSRFASVLMGAVTDGKAFLCLDSLDEVLPALRPDVIAFLNKEALHCGGTWIIGSRFTEYKGGQFAHSQFAEWELQTLDEQQRLTLARQLLPALYDALYGDVQQDLKPASPSVGAYMGELQRSTQMAAWGENPLLFSLAAVLYVQTGRLPASRAVLYAQVTEAMFAMRIHDAQQRAELRSLLAEIALEFYQTRGRNFSITDVMEFLSSRVSEQSTASLYATLTLLLDSGVLEPVAYQSYGFKHQMFQEYLAALALAHRYVDETQRQSTWELLWHKRRFSRWNEILRLLVGILVQEHGAEGLQRVREWLSALGRESSTAEGDPGNLCLILAMKSLGELGERGSEEEVEELVRHITEIWEKRFAELSPLGGWDYLQPLRMQVDVLYAFSLQIVAPIIMRVKQYDASSIRDNEISIDILWYLFQDRPLNFYECHSASVLKTAEVIERLVALLEKRDGNWSVEDRKRVVRQLGEMEEKAPVPLLIKIWQEETDVHEAAAQALREAQAFVPRDVFVTMLSDRDMSIKQIAAQALILQGGQADDDLILSALRPALQDVHVEVRQEAFRGLRELGLSLPIELVQTLFYDGYERISKAAWECLQEMGERVPLELWLDALQHAYTWVRNCALMALEDYKDQISVESILAMLSPDEDSRIGVLTSCIRALGILGERVPLEPLLELLHHRNETIRSHAGLVLARRHVALPMTILLSMLDYESTGSAAVQAIVTMGVDAPIAALLEELVRPQFRISYKASFASQALRLLYKYVPTEPILELLQDERMSNLPESIHWELIQLLQLQGVEIPLELFLPFLKRYPSETKSAFIVASLCRAGDQAPIEALLQLIYGETYEGRVYLEWIQQLFYVLYEYVSPDTLRSALSNTADDQWLAIYLLGLVHNEDSTKPMGDWQDIESALKQMAKLMPEQILERLHNDPRLEIRRAVLQAIQMTKDCKWLPLVLDTLQDIRSDALRTLGALNACAPLEVLLELLHTSKEGYGNNDERYDVLEALRPFGSRVPLADLWPLLSSSNTQICRLAFEHLQETHPDALKEVMPAIKAIARGEPVQGVFAARLDYRLAETVALMGRATPAVMEMVIERLDHPFWEVRVRAAQTLGTLRYNIPDGAIRRLLELRNDAESPDVRVAADQALAEILSLEQGMEDE